MCVRTFLGVCCRVLIGILLWRACEAMLHVHRRVRARPEGRTDACVRGDFCASVAENCFATSTVCLRMNLGVRFLPVIVHILASDCVLPASCVYACVCTANLMDALAHTSGV